MISREEGREIVRGLVEKFGERRSEYVRPNYNETLLRNDFLNQFLQALGWDVFNQKGHSHHFRDVIHEDTVEVSGEGEDALSKKPDYALRVRGRRKLFVEAKKPAVNISEHKSSAFQVRRYGWSAGLTVSVLTNFDKLIIYDCRFLPKSGDDARIARIKVFDFTDYISQFDEIYDLLSCDAVYSGKFDEAFNAEEEAVGQTFDQYFLKQIEGWRSSLALDLANHNAGISEDELNFLVQRLINRILFLRICEDRTLEKANALKKVETYEALKKLFLKADKRYNSGLFDFIEDKRSLSVEVDDALLVGIFKELYFPESPYDFSVVESSLLGEIYERFLARTIQLDESGVTIVEKPEILESGGIVSTPKFIIDAILESTLKPLCEGKTIDELAELRIADIACGSGGFLVAAYEFLQQYHVDFYVKDGPEKHRREIWESGNNEWRLTLPEKRRILLNNIFGVDIDIQAVEVTRFSLLLKALEGTTPGEVDSYLKEHKTQALPKLDKNIQCGNSLVDGSSLSFFEAENEEDQEEELAKLNPFTWQDSFPAVFRKEGFDLIIGNPPYIRIQNMVKYSPREAEFYQSPDSPYATAKSDNFDKYNLFIERSLSLVKPTGWLGYIVPHKFSVIRAGKALRSLISSGKHLREFVHFGEQQVFGKRVLTYVCILKLSKNGAETFKVERVADLAKWRYGHPGSITEYKSTEISDSPWPFFGERKAALFKRIRSLRVKNLDEVAEICNGPVKLDTKLLFESVDDYDVFDHWASNSAGVR